MVAEDDSENKANENQGAEGDEGNHDSQNAIGEKICADAAQKKKDDDDEEDEEEKAAREAAEAAEKEANEFDGIGIPMQIMPGHMIQLNEIMPG